jgi:riboflavin biosynthesis pyrimidine reductase
VSADAFRRLWPAPPLPDGAVLGGEVLDEAGLAAAYEPVPPPAPGRASVQVNFVTSIDGAVTVAGYTEALSSPADKVVFGLLRRGCDALLVGAGTLRHEGYGPLRMSDERRGWRRAHGRADHPTLVVVSGRLDLGPDHPALAGAPVRPVVVTHAGAPAPRRRALDAVADVLVCGDAAVDLAAAAAALAGRGLVRLLSEGGPQLLGALTAADLVDDMCLTIAPLLAGAGAGRITAGPPSPVRGLALHHVLAAGDELYLRYARAEPGPAP